jgi:hypothetical protein
VEKSRELEALRHRIERATQAVASARSEGELRIAALRLRLLLDMQVLGGPTLGGFRMAGDQVLVAARIAELRRLVMAELDTEEQIREARTRLTWLLRSSRIHGSQAERAASYYR